jgi:hypothetical protein
VRVLNGAPLRRRIMPWPGHGSVIAVVVEAARRSENIRDHRRMALR